MTERQADPVLGGGAAAVGLPGPRRLARGAGQGRAAPRRSAAAAAGSWSSPRSSEGSWPPRGSRSSPRTSGRGSSGSWPTSRRSDGRGPDVPAGDQGNRRAGVCRHRHGRRAPRPRHYSDRNSRPSHRAVDWALGVGTPSAMPRSSLARPSWMSARAPAPTRFWPAGGSDRWGVSSGWTSWRRCASGAGVTRPRPGSRGGPGSSGGRWRTSPCPMRRSTLISNGVINLSASQEPGPGRDRRVLRPGGRICGGRPDGGRRASPRGGRRSTPRGRGECRGRWRSVSSPAKMREDGVRRRLVGERISRTALTRPPFIRCSPPSSSS